MDKHINEATWSADPESEEWNADNNWEPAMVPTNIAVFSTSCKTAIGFSAKSEANIGAIQFSEEAPSYNFTIIKSADKPALTIEGDGILNDSPHIQSFNVTSKGFSFRHPQLEFKNEASAGGHNVSYYAGPESLDKGYGGGIIGFSDQATAGKAAFTVRTGAAAPPSENSTVGAEVSFTDNSNAGFARFMIYGTLGEDGDTFGNTVFHDNASASHGVFTNIGGTVPKGDGGNTQFYDNSSAAYGVFNNYGGNIAESNGGDVAFDGVANGGNAQFYNRVAEAEGAYGGVTSFNNNPPYVESAGASAGHALLHNYGAVQAGQGGGGHTEFTAKYGCPTAGNAHIFNYGSAISSKSSAGHTIFSISLPTDYFPTAGNAVFYNYPALAAGGAAGFTEFAVYDSGKGSNVPTAGNGTFFNLGGTQLDAYGGYTSFSGTSSAGNAKLIANSGVNGGNGGRIIFMDDSSGGSASIQLFGNGTLDLSLHYGSLTIDELESNGGIIRSRLGTNLTCINLTKGLSMRKSCVEFVFSGQDQKGFELNTSYTILTAPNLSDFSENQFLAKHFEGIKPTFSIVGNLLQVSFMETE